MSSSSLNENFRSVVNHAEQILELNVSNLKVNQNLNFNNNDITFKTLTNEDLELTNLTVNGNEQTTEILLKGDLDVNGSSTFDAPNVLLGKTGGSISFFGQSPAVGKQTIETGGNTAQNITAINNTLTKLANLGLITTA